MLGGFVEKYRLAVREARFIRVSLLLAMGLNLLTWGLFIWFVAPRISTSPFFALHYTIYFGVDRIGPSWHIGAAPLLGSFIIAVNLFLMTVVYVRDRLAGAFLMSATVVFQSLLLFSVFLVVLLNL